MSPKVQVVFDTSNPHVLAEFWAQAMAYVREDHHEIVTQLLAAGRLASDEAMDVDGRRAFRDVATCVDPDGVGPRLFFQRVPEPKQGKNRVHLDLQVGPANAPAEVERLLGLGASVAWTISDRGPVTTTMRDPEGNEFCVS